MTHAVFKTFIQDKRGATSVEFSLLIMMMIALTGGTVEAGNAFFQWNNAQQAARIGARIASTSDPVPAHLQNWTGLSNTVNVGDPLPDYTITCQGSSNSCSQGSFNTSAMNNIVFGPDNDSLCSPTDRPRQGMCDVFDRLNADNVTIEYASSGLGRAGNPADPAPLITVTITGVDFNFVFLDFLTPKAFRTMPDVHATVMSEDLRTGA